MLGKGHRDADEHTDRADEDQHELDRAELHRLEQEVGQSQDGVDAALGQNARDQHRDGGRGRAVRVGGQGVERDDEGFRGEADVEQREGDERGGVDVAGDDAGQLREVQRVGLGVEHDRAGQDAGRAHAADDQVLERRLQRAEGLVAERGERDGGKGQDLDHDEHVEEVAREHKAHNAAGEHQEQGVVFGDVVVMIHVLQRVHAGDEHRRCDEQAEEQADLVDLHRDADGIAAGHGAAAHPVADDLVVEHDGLNEQDHAAKRDRRRAERDQAAQELVPAEEHDQERAEEQRHHRVDREVLIA